jgi:hypothetical protein
MQEHSESREEARHPKEANPRSDGAPWDVLGAVRLNDSRHRRNFLKWMSLAGLGASLAVATKDRFATAQSPRDVDILNYALTLEYLERDFFTRGLGARLLTGRDAALVEEIRGHENEHVSALESTITDLGGTPVPSPRLEYPKGVFRDRGAWLDVAAKLEGLAVGAYHGQVRRIRDANVLAAAAAIAGTESRHAAILAELSGGDPFPAPLEDPKSQTRVLRAARPFLKS